jgi:hypothetical protein
LANFKKQMLFLLIMSEFKTMYEYAQINEYSKFRQAYLNSIKPMMPTSVSELIYDDSGIEVVKHVCKMNERRDFDQQRLIDLTSDVYGHFDKTSFMVLSYYKWMGSGEKHPIFVLPRAFASKHNEEIFLNTLVDHEAFHTDSLTNGLVLPNGKIVTGDNAEEYGGEKFLHYVEEFLACDNQLAAFDKKNIHQPQAREYIVNKKNHYMQILHNNFPAMMLSLDIFHKSL